MIPAKKTTSEFEKVYSLLNVEQKWAVDQIQGPVLVYAGPGTGKTRVLTVRIGNILQLTDAAPGNILCLTFSRSGAASMKEKLTELIGPEAEKVAIHTFHSFANVILDIYNKNSDSQPLRAITEAQQYMILERILNDPKIAGASFLTEKPRGGAYLSSLIAFIQEMKKEMKEGADLVQFISDTINQYTKNKDNYTKTGVLKSPVQKSIEKLQKFQSMGDIYDAYEQILDAKGLMDYEDMITQSISVLDQNPSLLNILQEKYQYILVDEFQDTNRKQLYLLQFMIKGQEHPNLFIVGDDDQCIYRFQGANNENIAFLEKQIRKMQKVTLRSNYRSTKAILDTAHGFISKNPLRPVEKNEPLVPGTSEKQGGQQPQIHAFETPEDEAFFIASEIQKKIEQGIASEEIAVLFRKWDNRKMLLPWLRYFGIPHRLQSQEGDLLDTTWGKRIYHAVKWLSTDDKNSSLADTHLKALLSEIKGKEWLAVLLHDIRSKQPRENKSVYSWIKTNEDYSSTAYWLSESEQADLTGSLEGILNWVEIWTGLDSLRMPGNSSLVTNWDESLKSFLETDKKRTLHSFADWLQYHEHYKIKIPYKPAGTEPGIVLSTLHGSKGLEYTAVFIMGCSDTNWEKSREPRSKISVPVEISNWLKQSTDELEDLRRLKYVGITRAQEHIIMTFDTSNYFSSPKNPSFFINELVNTCKLPIQYHKKYDHKELQAAYRNWEGSDTLRTIVRSKLETYELSPSALNTYITQPDLFIDQHILGVTAVQSETLAFGTLMHDALESFYKDKTRLVYTDDALSDLWNSKVNDYQQHFDALHFEQYRKYGLEIFMAYVKNIGAKEEAVEYMTELFLHGKMGDARIAGKIDLIIRKGDTISVIDFKTGKYSQPLEPFLNEWENGNGYWRQAAIYQELVRQNFPGVKIESFSFHYPEISKSVSFDLDYNREAWEKYVIGIWEQLMQLRFPAYAKAEYFG